MKEIKPNNKSLWGILRAYLVIGKEFKGVDPYIRADGKKLIMIPDARFSKFSTFLDYNPTKGLRRRASTQIPKRIFIKADYDSAFDGSTDVLVIEHAFDRNDRDVYVLRFTLLTSESVSAEYEGMFFPLMSVTYVFDKELGLFRDFEIFEIKSRWLSDMVQGRWRSVTAVDSFEEKRGAFLDSFMFVENEAGELK